MSSIYIFEDVLEHVISTIIDSWKWKKRLRVDDQRYASISISHNITKVRAVGVLNEGISVSFHNEGFVRV